MKFTAWSSIELSVSLAIAFNRSIINLFIAFDFIKSKSIGFKTFNMMLNMSYFPNIAVFVTFSICCL